MGLQPAAAAAELLAVHQPIVACSPPGQPGGLVVEQREAVNSAE